MSSDSQSYHQRACVQMKNTSLHIAAHEGHFELVELLLKHRASINLQNKVSVGFGPETRRLRVACLCCNLYSCKCGKFWGTCVHTGRRLRVRSSHDLRACFFDIESNLCSLGWLVSVFQNSAPTGEGEDALRLCTASGQGVVDFSNRTDSCSRPPTQTHACTRNSSISSCLHT